MAMMLFNYKEQWGIALEANLNDWWIGFRIDRYSYFGAAFAVKASLIPCIHLVVLVAGKRDEVS